MKKKLVNLFRLLRKLLKGKYDPVSYWGGRANPNSPEGESQKRVDFDVGYISQAIGDVAESVLELGPGVGRTFKAYYKSNIRVTTLDISRKYADDLLLASQKQGIELEQFYLDTGDSVFPFENNAFPVGVASQVLLHIPPVSIRHSLSELIRVCEKVVVITAYAHGKPTKIDHHVFNHDYFSLCTELGCSMHNVVMNEGRICFTIRKLS